MFFTEIKNQFNYFGQQEKHLREELPKMLQPSLRPEQSEAPSKSFLVFSPVDGI
jgi:hypothetical protein